MHVQKCMYRNKFPLTWAAKGHEGKLSHARKGASISKRRKRTDRPAPREFYGTILMGLLCLWAFETSTVSVSADVKRPEFTKAASAATAGHQRYECLTSNYILVHARRTIRMTRGARRGVVVRLQEPHPVPAGCRITVRRVCANVRPVSKRARARYLRLRPNCQRLNRPIGHERPLEHVRFKIHLGRNARGRYRIGLRAVRIPYRHSAPFVAGRTAIKVRPRRGKH